GSNSIFLPFENYNLTIAGAGEDNAASGDLDIKNDLTIRAGGVIIDAQSLDRVFEVFPTYHLTLNSLMRIQNGRAPQGGGIYNAGSLTLQAIDVDFNQAVGADGAAGASGGAGQAGGTGGDGASAYGGGIYNAGQ